MSEVYRWGAFHIIKNNVEGWLLIIVLVHIVEWHPVKTLIGKSEHGFDFIGYNFKPDEIIAPYPVLLSNSPYRSLQIFPCYGQLFLKSKPLCPQPCIQL